MVFVCLLNAFFYINLPLVNVFFNALYIQLTGVFVVFLKKSLEQALAN